MLWCETVLVGSSEEICVDGWQNQSFQDFPGQRSDMG